MAVKVTTLQFTASTGGGTQQVAHGHGATPEAALFFYTKATSLETARAHSNIGFGFSDGTTNKCSAGRSQDNVATTVTRQREVDSAICFITDNDDTTDGDATASFGATNLTLTWNEAPSTANYIQCILFSGLDGAKVLDAGLSGTSAAAITHNLGLTVGNEALVFAMGHAYTGTSQWPTFANDCKICLGVAHWDGTSTFTSRSFAYYEDRAENAGRPAGYLDTSNILRAYAANYSLVGTASISDWQTNDFDITGSVSGMNDYYAFLVLGLPSGVSAKVGDISAPTTLGSQAYTPLSWEPQHVGLFTTQIETKDSFRQNNDGDEAGAWGMSGLDSSQGISACHAVENDSEQTDTQSTAATKAVYMPADDGSLAASASAGNGCHASFTSLDSTGWTIDTTSKSANSTQTYWIYWAIEAEATGDITRSATITATGSVAAAANREISRGATITATGAVAATAENQIPRSATITAVGSVSATAENQVPRSATITATGSVSATRTVDTGGVFTRTATVTATGAVAAAYIEERLRSAAISATGAVSATGTTVQTFSRSATITAIGSVSATGSVPSAVTTARKGAGKPRKKRRITVDGRTYMVSSVEEERAIVARFVAKLEAQKDRDDTSAPQMKRKLTIQRRRLRRLEQTAEIAALMHRQRLFDEDEEILMLLAA